MPLTCKGRQVPYPLQPHILCLLPLLLLLGMLWLLAGGEEQIVLFCVALRKSSPVLNKAVVFYSNWGNVFFYFMYFWLLLKAIKTRNVELRKFVLTYVVVQVFVALLLTYTLKFSVGKPRPFFGHEYISWSAKSAYHSFPSGHTTEMFCSCFPLALRYGHIILPLLLGCFAAAMGFTRMALAMHYPSDLLGSAALGSLGAYLVWFIAIKDVFKKKA